MWIKPSENHTSSPQQQSDFRTRTSQKITPAEPSENHTIETKQLNEKQKQQIEVARLLKKEGFDSKTAEYLATRYPQELLTRQIKWLSLRNITKSRAGLLRRAIEGDWPEPGRELQQFVRFQEPPPQTLPAAYLTWLSEQQIALHEESPDDYQRFLAKRDRLRADHLKERSNQHRQHLLTTHDLPARQLMDFQKFFALPDVQRWGETINNQSAQPTS